VVPTASGGPLLSSLRVSKGIAVWPIFVRDDDRAQANEMRWRRSGTGRRPHFCTFRQRPAARWPFRLSCQCTQHCRKLYAQQHQHQHWLLLSRTSSGRSFASWQYTWEQQFSIDSRCHLRVDGRQLKKQSTRPRFSLVWGCLVSSPFRPEASQSGGVKMGPRVRSSTGGQLCWRAALVALGACRPSPISPHFGGV